MQYNNCFFRSVPILLPSVIAVTLQAQSVLRPRSTFSDTDPKHYFYCISKTSFFLTPSFWKSDSDFFGVFFVEFLAKAKIVYDIDEQTT